MTETEGGWIARFENALGELIEQHVRAGMSGSDVQKVLQAHVDDDYVALEIDQCHLRKEYGLPSKPEREEEQAQEAEARLQREQEAMDEHFRKHPHG